MYVSNTIILRHIVQNCIVQGHTINIFTFQLEMWQILNNVVLSKAICRVIFLHYIFKTLNNQ